MNDLIKQNKGLVISIAKRYQGRGLDMDDLLQEGYIGLLEAHKRYDSTKGVKFSTYASIWIKQAICKAIMDTGSLVRIPVWCNTMQIPNHKGLLADRSYLPELDSVLDYPKIFKGVPDSLVEIFVMLSYGYTKAEVALHRKVSRQYIGQVINKYKDKIKANIGRI